MDFYLLIKKKMQYAFITVHFVLYLFGIQLQNLS